MIQILLVDDHPSVMEGTKMLLEQEGDMQVTLVNSCEEALKIVKQQSFDVMLFDLHMPDLNGLELAKQALKLVPEAIILIYTGFEFKNHFNLMIEAGVAGFVLKTANKEQLVAAVRCAIRGEVILPLSLVKQLRKNGLQMVGSEVDANVFSNKEYEILRELVKGKSNKDVADAMLMSQRSLEYCLTSLFQKLKVKSRIEAVIKAKELGLLMDFDNYPLE